MVQVLCMHHNGCNWLTSLFHNLQAALSNPIGPQDSHVSQQDLLQLVGLCCQPIILYSPLSVRNPLSTSKLRGQWDLDHGSLTQGPSRRWGARAFLSRSATQQVFGLHSYLSQPRRNILHDLPHRMSTNNWRI